MSDSGKLLDLTAVEDERTQVKLDNSDRHYGMKLPEEMGPRELARIGRIARLAKTNIDEESFTEELADEIESVITDAACLIIPDAPREAVATLPFVKRQRIVEHFMKGFGPLIEARQQPDPKAQTSES